MITVIDISQYQPPSAIDYDKLAGAVDGVILRCAYGTRKDNAFETHYAEFTKRGIPMGVYLFLVGYKTSAEQVIVLRQCMRTVRGTAGVATRTQSLVQNF